MGINTKDNARFERQQIERLDITGTVGGTSTAAVGDIHIAVVPPASSTHTVTMPSAGEAAGQTYVVYSNGNDTGTVVVAFPNTEPNIADQSLTADNDYACAYSNGFTWILLAAVTT